MEEKMVKIKQNLKVAQDRQKSYANKEIVVNEFKMGDHVYLKFRPKKSSMKLGNCPKRVA